MDWESSTTKKHIAEAIVQGCTLLGSGKNKDYRKYLLNCGHKQEVAVVHMRHGNFRCHACLAEKLNAEANANKCELLGLGRTKNFRLYRLECGHEQEIQINEMRRGNFRCRACFEIKLEEEALIENCKLVGSGRNHNYRLYLLSCGHTQEITVNHMRNGVFRCLACYENTLREEARLRECEVIGPGRSSDYRLYRLSCRHEQEVQTTNMRNSGARCETCLQEKLLKEAEKRGCRLLGPGSTSTKRLYRLECGHELEVDPGAIRSGRFHCKICFEVGLKAEAMEHECELLDKESKPGFRIYGLKCGHEQEVQIGNMRRGLFQCQTCGDTHYTRPSNLYLLHITVGPDQWLKLGFSNNVDNRIVTYGLPVEAQVSLIASQSFDTGLEAVRLEKNLHTQFRNFLLDPSEMSRFHTLGGQTECYPINLLDKLLSKFK